MRKVTVSRMRERYAQTVLTFRITYVAWNEGKARKVVYFETASGGKRISDIFIVSVLNSIAKFGWVAYLIDV